LTLWKYRFQENSNRETNWRTDTNWFGLLG